MAGGTREERTSTLASYFSLTVRLDEKLRKGKESMSKDNDIGVPKPGEQPNREQLKELLLRVLDAMADEKEREQVMHGNRVPP